MTLLCENILNIWSKGKCFVPISERKQKSHRINSQLHIGEISDYNSVILQKIRW